MAELEEWDPFRELRRLQKRLFYPLGGFSELKVREPLMDIIDKGKELEIIAELPGVDKKDINIDVTEKTIAIKAKSAHKEEEKKEGYYYHERAYESYARQMSLPAEVIPESTKAEFKNGVLTVVLKKKHPEEEKRKGFQVKIE